MRRLIVNADDLGLTEATTAGIVHAHRHGIVTSASLMVRPPAARSAVRAAAAAGLDDLGLHLDLGEWAFRDGRWQPLYEVAGRDDPAAVAAECRAQLETFRDLVGRDPTHLDSHQHVHLDDPLRATAVALAAEIGVPLRHLAPGVRHCGGFYGQTGRGEPATDLLTPESLLELLARECDARPDHPVGAVELGCHPGWDAELDTMYVAERRVEVEVLCSPGLREAITALGFELSTFPDLASDPCGDPHA